MHKKWNNSKHFDCFPKDKMDALDAPMARKIKRESNDDQKDTMMTDTVDDYTNNVDVDDNAGLSGEIAEECFKCRNKWGGDGQCHQPCLALTLDLLFKNISNRLNNLKGEQ